MTDNLEKREPSLRALRPDALENDEAFPSNRLRAGLIAPGDVGAAANRNVSRSGRARISTLSVRSGD